MIKPDHVALASFPRSGNTWLRLLLEAITGKTTGSIYFDRDLAQSLHGEGKTRGCFLVKTHNYDYKHVHSFDRALHLVRHPVQALESYAHYAIAARIRESDPSIYRSEEPIGKDWIYRQALRWGAFQESWLNFPGPRLLVRYEDLQFNTRFEIERIYRFLFNRRPPPLAVENALSKSLNRYKRPKTGRVHISQEIEHTIESELGSSLEKFGYSVSSIHESPRSTQNLSRREKLNRVLSKNNLNKKRLVYQLSRRGFASELNQLLSAILYCLHHEMEFCLYSKGWCATVGKGWQDFFLPFCKETSNDLLLAGAGYEVSASEKESFEKYRDSHSNVLFTHEIWKNIRCAEFRNLHFRIPELEIDGDILEAKRNILERCLQYNSSVYRRIRPRLQLRNNITPFIGVHVRRGDKKLEADPVSIEHYIAAIRGVAGDIRTIYLATDSYNVVEAFRESCSDWKIYNFCSVERTGYTHHEFNCQLDSSRYEDMLDLFVDLEFLKAAHWFIGTYSSNLSRLVGVFRGDKNCVSLDVEKWHPA